MQFLGAGLFALALAHTFSTKYFERLAHRRPDHAGAWHLLAEVEVVFGFWAMVLVVLMATVEGRGSATTYLEERDFTEPMFVFAIMVVAGSRAVLEVTRRGVERLAAIAPARGAIGFYAVALSLVPLLGSLITEPAAMTLAALMLRDRLLAAGAVSRRLKYATVGVLFVNVSIGGTLTPFAAPPVLMVATTWHWDLWHMLAHFGWRSALAVAVNTAIVTALFRAELAAVLRPDRAAAPALPGWVTALHVLFLVSIVAFAHHPPMFLGLLLLFLGFATAYPQHQNRLMLREGLMVAFFLAGLVVLGGQQRWWLEPLLRGMSTDTVFFGATALTAITDNAALTYLGSLVDGLTEEFKYALVAGAVTGGGLTVIANAPNPAGYSILRDSFDDGAIHPLGLLLAALPPTLVAVAAFWLL
jgi:Na+/H+ antiporter NhaD/arsenite permease-like protein